MGTGKAGDINISSGGDTNTDQLGNITISTPLSASTTPGQGDITLVANGYAGNHGAYIQIQNTNPRDSKGGDLVMGAGNGNGLDDGAGNVTLTGGNGVYSMPGGSVTVSGGGTGGGFDADGGDLFLTGGTKSNNGRNGNVLMAQSVGTVGVGTTIPGAKLDVTDASTTTSAIIVPRAGNFTGTNVNGMIRYNTTSTLFEFRQNGVWVNYTTVSDGRLKTNVKPVVDGLSIINQLNPVFYDWDRSNPKTTSFEDRHQVGFIAQDVEKVLPEVVNRGEDSYRSLEYGKIVSVVVAAVKELYAQFADQKRQIASLDAENKKLKEENTATKSYLCAKDPQAAICK